MGAVVKQTGDAIYTFQNAAPPCCFTHSQPPPSCCLAPGKDAACSELPGNCAACLQSLLAAIRRTALLLLLFLVCMSAVLASGM